MFDRQRKPVATVGFSTGWRVNEVISIERIRAPGTEQELLAMHVDKQELGGPGGTWQYYAVDGDRLRLVRLEDSSRKLSANIYQHPNHTIGPSPPRQSLQQWRETLAHEGWSARLEALTWMGGVHRSRDVNANVSHETLEDAELVQALRADADVREEIELLAESGDAWTRDAAAAARKYMK